MGGMRGDGMDGIGDIGDIGDIDRMSPNLSG